MTLERSKWQKELSVFIRLVNTIVLTGNIYDQHPIINEREQKLQGFCTLDLYLARTCQSLGYEGILLYDPVSGFRSAPGLSRTCQVLSVLEEIVSEARKEEEEQERALRLRSRRNGRGEASFVPDSIEDAARMIHLFLERCQIPAAVLVSYTSRMMARPDDLEESERMIFLHFQERAAGARRNPVSGPEGQKNKMLKNQLFLMADKLNDLPAWYCLSHPGLKNIHIPKPDYRMRDQIIGGYSMNFPGYAEAAPEDRALFHDTFVGATEGFTTQDIARVFQAAKIRRLDIHSIDKAILLYKHGVQDNPWLRLDAGRLSSAEEQIRRRVLGQETAVRAAVDIVKRAVMGMSGLQHSGASSKPRGILFLAGPTGTGKTELAKALTELIFLDERNMIRFDMSEYRQEQSDQRLLGAPPGYVGYEAGGQLTNAVREHPFSVLLFDEIEKAHPSVLDKFLQILEDGRITDGRGETVYFQDCLIIFTSNLGMTVPSEIHPGVRVPGVCFEEDQEYETVRERILGGVTRYFNEELGRPELLNRIGENILVFDFIRKESLRPILDKQIRSIARNLWADKQIRLLVTEQARQDLYEFAEKDLPKGQGGRGIGNMVEKMLLNPLAGFLFDHGAVRDTQVTVERIFEKNNRAELTVKVTG